MTFLFNVRIYIQVKKKLLLLNMGRLKQVLFRKNKTRKEVCSFTGFLFFKFLQF